jgi:hypothetical protein
LTVVEQDRGCVLMPFQADAQAPMVNFKVADGVMSK